MNLFDILQPLILVSTARATTTSALELATLRPNVRLCRGAGGTRSRAKVLLGLARLAGA